MALPSPSGAAWRCACAPYVSSPFPLPLSLALTGQCADDGVQDYKPLQLGGPSNLHKDILENRDCSLDWEDVYPGNPLSFFCCHARGCGGSGGSGGDGGGGDGGG